jgi:MOSC domain-containing protein YiiM
MLVPSKLRGRVEVLLVNNDRTKGLSSQRVDQIDASYAGFAGEAHSGLTRPSCVRVKQQYEQGTEIRNTRQITILSTEEISQIAENMGIDKLRPEWIGANLVLSGIPSLTLLPPSTRLIFESGVSIVVDMENGPCSDSGASIDKHQPGYGDRFSRAAADLRGVTSWVERQGSLAVGMECRLHIPIQRAWPNLPKRSA